MKKVKFILAATATLLLMVMVFQYGCKKAQLEQTNSDYEQLIAAKDYSNNELVRLIKLTDPPLSDHELMGIMIAASPLEDNIIKELLKRGQPPCSCALSDETLQMILLFNLPLSDHILKEMEKYDIKLSRSLLEKIDLPDLPDMELEKANLLMEGLLNLKFGCGDCEYHLIEMVRDTVEVYGILESGKYFILAQEFITSLEEMDIRCKSASDVVTIPCKSKHIRAVDLEIITSLDPDGNKVFKVAFTPVVAVTLVLNPKCSFDNTDCWWWGGDALLQGGCCPANTSPIFNAASRIEATANWNCGVQLACTFFAAPLQIVNITPDQVPNVNDPGPNDNYYDALLFENVKSTNWPLLCQNYHECLDFNVPGIYTQQNEMQFYLEGAVFIANNPLFKPAGKHIIAYDMFPDPRLLDPFHPAKCFPEPLKRVGHQLFMVYGACESNVPVEN